MCSLNNENSTKSEESPSSALENEVVNMELTIVTPPPASEPSENDNGILPDVVVEAKVYGDGTDQSHETYLSIAIQVFIPFLIAGLGMVFAGLVFDKIQVNIRNNISIQSYCNVLSSIGLYSKKLQNWLY